MNKPRYFCRPETGSDDIIGPTFGPFDDFLQLTYGELRVGPDGEPIASYGNGFYFFNTTFRKNGVEVPIPFSMKDAHNLPADWPETGFSDVVIWAE